MKDTIDLLPKRKKVVRPEDYLSMTTEERANVKTSRFIPPTIGGSDFGRFVITLKNPVYCLADGEE